MLEKVWRKGSPVILLWECKLVQPLWQTVWRFLKKLKIELPYDPAIPLLGVHTEETRIKRDMCTPMIIAALFTIADFPGGLEGKVPACNVGDSGSPGRSPG